MKKVLKSLLAFALVVSMSACSSTSSTTVESSASESVETGIFTAGTYEAEADGFQGKVKVTVTVDANSITEITVDESENGSQLLTDDDRAALAQKVIDATSIDVDTVSGATISSNAILTAIGEALTVAGADLSQLTNQAGEVAKATVEETVDVVVAGAGAAGLAAALTALQNGKTVLVVEKQGVAGGASAMAGAGTVATGSDWAVEDGSTETAEDLKNTLFANGHNNNYEPTVDIFVNTVDDMFNWLVSEDGANVPYKRSLSGRTYSAEGRGAGVISSFMSSVEAAGGTVLTSTPATSLLVEDGVVTGIVAESEDTVYTIHANSVILATGGFGNNDEMVPEKYLSFVYAGAAGATGDGIIMAEAVDANTVNMEFVNVQPNSIIMPSGLGQYTNPGVGKAYATSGAFLVSEEGVRFANETGSAWTLLNEMAENTATYLIMDQTSFDAFNAGMEGSKIYSEENVTEWLANDGSSNPHFYSAESIDELADKLGIDSETLAATVEKFNSDVAAGTDEFGRTLTAELAAEGPYYAVQMYDRYYATLGGLEVNENMQVLNTKGEVISGLYAAGETVGGLEGDIYLMGSLFAWALTSGHNAGLAVSE